MNKKEAWEKFKETGNIEYYLCECGKMFYDHLATNEVKNPNDVVIAKLGHNYCKKITDLAYIKEKASDCQHFDSYWYACERCDASAKDDKKASDKFYSTTTTGPHDVLDEWRAKDGKHFHECVVSGCDFTMDEDFCSGGIAT